MINKPQSPSRLIMPEDYDSVNNDGAQGGMPIINATLGGAMGNQNSQSVVLNVITEFTNEFRTVIDGNTNDLSLNELSGGARISFVYHELFNNGVRSIDPFDQVKDGDIRTILYNSSVRFVSGFSGS